MRTTRNCFRVSICLLIVLAGLLIFFGCKKLDDTTSSSAPAAKQYSSYEIEYPSNVLTIIHGSDITLVEFGADYSILISMRDGSQIHSARYKKLAN